MKICGNYPLNICPVCGGELKQNQDTGDWICQTCDENWSDMINVTKQNPYDPATMR